MADSRTRIAFLIRRLDRGGAERQLIELARGLSKANFEVSILTFYGGGAFAAAVTAESGIKLVCLEKGGRWDIVGFLSRLIRAVRRLRPHIIHGYMGGANELSIIAGRACGAHVVWGLRASEIVSQSVIMRGLFRAGAILSSQADRIISNSQCGRSFHVAAGYCDDRIAVIPNGIDTQLFSIAAERREAVRREWRIDDDEILIGRAARLATMKDFPSFLRAAALVSRVYPNAKFACIGDGTDCGALHQIAAAQGIAARVIWSGGRDDMPAVYNALDICVSSSISGEGFPNAVAESMACGTPCVATDVGDSALLVADAGIIVGGGDPEAIAEGILRLIRNRRQYPPDRVRKRITENFSAEHLVARTAAELEQVLRS